MRKSSFSPLCYWDRIRLYSIRSLQFCASMKWRTIHAITLHWLLAAPHFHQLPTVGADEYITRHVQNFGQNPPTQTSVSWVAVTFLEPTWRLSWCLLEFLSHFQKQHEDCHDVMLGAVTGMSTYEWQERKFVVKWRTRRLSPQVISFTPIGNYMINVGPEATDFPLKGPELKTFTLIQDTFTWNLR